MIEIKQISKNYGEIKAVEDLNFTIEKGEVLGLLGPNGAGKSTTIRMLCCYLKPTEGNIIVNGKSILENSQLVKKMIGYLPESAPLYSDMIVYDYLNYIAEIRGIEKDKKEKRIKELAETCVIKEVMSKNISQLSKGYKQRVGLAHALMGDPEILVLDEPTSGLDPNQIIEIRELIKKIGKKKTVIICSHILSEVEATCNRVVIISKGKVVADGTTETLKKGNVKSKTVLLEIAKEGNLDEKQIEKKMASIKNVSKVKTMVSSEKDVFKYEISYQCEADIRKDIYQFIKKNNWILLTFYKQENTLESVFRNLTN